MTHPSVWQPANAILFGRVSSTGGMIAAGSSVDAEKIWPFAKYLVNCHFMDVPQDTLAVTP
jgi:hypothetical protein